ncbi:hypothetical protein KCU61_g7845, partial [Aureobasidium melanogenum]
MRFSSYALPALAANLAAALPAAQPQEIDLSMVLDTPDPTFSQAVGVAAQTVTYDAASLIAVASAAASSVSIAVSDVLSQTAVISKRAATATTCVPQLTGASSAPTYSAGADNAANFLADTYYASVASAAPIPTGYNQAFTDQQASCNAFGYLGYDTFDTYDIATCAGRCTARNGCVSFNMYFERDPSGCSNSSVTMIKCVYWGGPVSQANAAGTPFGDFAINAPYDAQGYNTFMGARIFTSTWQVASCAAYCDSQTAYNKATAPTDGTPYKVCNFFNTYVLTEYLANGSVVPQGQYCASYTEAWNSTYAVNGGQWWGEDQYLVSYSFGYPKLNPGIDPSIGDPIGAEYQAVADIKWASLQPFCSSYLGYTTPITIITTTTTSTLAVTAMMSQTTMTAQNQTAVQNQKRALSTPDVLTKYPSTVLFSACQLQATQPAASTLVVTETITATATTTTAVSTVAT